MATYDEDDVIKGYIEYKLQDYPRASFLMKETVDVGTDETISINGAYTSDGSTTSDKKIFEGYLEEGDFRASQKVEAKSYAQEIDAIRPSGTYSGYADIVMGTLVTEYCNHVTCSRSTNTFTLRPNSDVSQGAWEDETLGDDDGDLYDDVDESSDDGSQIFYESGQPTSAAIFGLTNHSLSSSYNYNIYKMDVIVSCCYDGAPEDTIYLEIGYYDGDSYIEDQTIEITENDSTAPYTCAEITATWEDLFYTADETDDFRVDISAAGIVDINGIIVDRVELKCYYEYFPNLDKSSNSIELKLGGEKTLKDIFNETALNELSTWYLDPDLELYISDGTTDSGADFLSTDNIQNVDGVRQMKSYDRVILHGGYSGASYITSDTGSGTKVFKDTYPTITDQTILDTLRGQIETEQARNPYTITLERRNTDEGLIQVGEYVDISANDIKFRDSTRYIPTEDYVINKCIYKLGNGTYISSIYELNDSLVLSLPHTTFETRLKRMEKGIKDNASLIDSLSVESGIGENNTGQNMGTGEGVYSGKSGATLQFHSIAGGTNISATLASETITLDYDLTIGSDIQAWDDDLDDIAALAHSDGNFIVSNGTDWVVESGATARTSLGLGSIATQNSIDISDDTNLSAGTNITLNDDTLNVDDVFLTKANNLSDLANSDTALGNLNLDTELKNLSSAEIDYLEALYATGVTSTEYDYLDGVTSNIQTQLNAKLETVDISADTNLSVTAPITLTDDDIGFDGDLADLSDVNSNLQTVLISQDDSGTGVMGDGTVDGEVYWDQDSEAFYRWDNTAGAWIQIGGGTDASYGSVDDLTDTTISGPADNDLLQYSAGDSEWQDKSLSEAGIMADDADLNDLDDVNAGSPSDGQVLEWDNGASEWIAADVGGGSTGTSLDIGQLYDTNSQYNNGSWTKVTFDTNDIETDDSVIDVDTSNNKITVKEDGKYLIYYNAFARNDTSARRGQRFCVYINGAYQDRHDQFAYTRNANAEGRGSASCALIEDLSANDYIELYHQEKGGGSNNVQTTKAVLGVSKLVAAGDGYLEYEDEDPSSWDMTASDFTIDSSYHEMDLDSYKTVPNGAVGFVGFFVIKETASGPNYRIYVRDTSQTNTHQKQGMRTQVINVNVEGILVVPLDSNNKFDYLITSGMDVVNVIVLWWIYEG